MRQEDRFRVADHLKQVVGSVHTASPHRGKSKKVRWKQRRRVKMGLPNLAVGAARYGALPQGNLIERAAAHLVPSVTHTAFGRAIAGYECTQIFRVENEALRRRFNAMVGKIGNVRELWHGTQITSALQIVREGLRVGGGGMFGGGIYTGPFAKAVNYGGAGASVRFMLKVRVALGRVWYATEAGGWLTGPVVWSHGFHTIAGMGKVTKSFAGTLRGDEYVVYDPAQVLVTEIWEFRRFTVNG